MTANYTTPGSPVIQKNQTTLINDVPTPVLDPSERGQILADAAAERAAGEADRLEVIEQLRISEDLLQIFRQSILNEVNELRDEIREKAHTTQAEVDNAVDAAQLLAETVISAGRQLIEVVYRVRENGYLNEQRGLEEFRDASLKLLNLGRTTAIAQRETAQQKVAAADQKAFNQRALVLASADAHVNRHFETWDAEYKAFLADIEAAGEKILDKIQLTLDLAGFAPGVGAIPDLINAAISAGRGNFGEAAFNLAAAVPGIGDAIKGGKMIAQGVKHGDEVIAMASLFARKGDKAKDILKSGDEAGEILGKNLDELAKEDAIIHLLDDGEDIAALGISAFSGFKYAARFGIKSYDELATLTKGMGVQVHHLIEERLAKAMGQKPGEMLSVVLTPAEHQAFTNAWRKHFPYEGEIGHIPYRLLTPQQIQDAARKVYAGFPEILQALGLK